jgi:DNA-binding NtrC family response regulator
MVVFDIWRGEMTGPELQEQLREHSPQTRVLVMTGQVDPGATNKALNAGAIEFFTEPFDDNQSLAQCVARWQCTPVE